jgi:acylglycerol lipase
LHFDQAAHGSGIQGRSGFILNAARLRIVVRGLSSIVRRRLISMARPTLLVLGLACSSCAPHIQVVGPPVDKPSLTETTFHTADGVNLPLRIWRPWKEPDQDRPRGVILALHGFNDYSAGLTLPAHGLARRGFIVYAFDQRGFGEAPQRGIWAGSEQMITDLKAAAKLLKEKYTNLPLYLLGESMGAAVIMSAAVENDPPAADGLVLVAPAIWGWQTQSAFNRNALELAGRAVPWMTVVPTGLRIKATSNRNALIALSRDPLVIKETRVDAAYGLVDLMSRAYDAADQLASPRTLVLFGGRDSILNSGAVGATLKRLQKVNPATLRIALYPRAYHLMLRDWDAPKIYDDIAAWLTNPEAGLPSGADQTANLGK